MKKIILLLVAMFFTLLMQAQISKALNLTTAGTLSSSLTATEKSTVTNLTLSGTIDARDFKIMRDSMPVLAVLDLNSATIQAYPIITPIYPANELPDSSFYSYSKVNTSLTTIKLPTTLTSIGNSAFAVCTRLSTVTIPNSVTSIGIGAFSSCIGLASLTIPSSVTSISDYIFYACAGLTSIIIPSSVTSIGDKAFSDCTGLSTVTIPSSVTSIGDRAFSGCSGFISVDANNRNYSSCDGVLFDKAQIILIQYPTTKEGSYNIPLTVSSIGQEAFYGCTELTGTLTIPSSVTSIGDYAFYSCTGLNNLIIPSSVTSIGAAAFEICTGLTSIYANSTLPIHLGYSSFVFYNVNKTTCSLYVPVGSKSAYQAAYQWRDFVHIVETSNVTAIPAITNATINVYPNPTIESFQIKGLEGSALITLRDLNVKTLLTKQITGNENVSVSSLSKGIYMLEIKTNEGSILRKIEKN